MKVKDKMCLTKRLYTNFEDAETALHYRQKRTNKILRIYKCPFCKGYHLTSKKKFEEVE